jgi:hypothetical protein
MFFWECPSPPYRDLQARAAIAPARSADRPARDNLLPISWREAPATPHLAS